jgi:2-C-methyl-D-erythritol 4-phosphate cytidylyltransferase
VSSTGSRVAAIVVAGGAGTRFGGPKQFLELAGRSVAARSVDAARSVASHVVLVAPAGTTEAHGADVVVVGGASRAASVRAGLAVIGAEFDVIVVHDAARPLASAALFDAVVAQLDEPSVDGAICAVAVADTIKRVGTINGRLQVIETIPRADLVAVQTPQAFRAGILRAAHDAGDEATDDAGLVEAIGGTIAVVPGAPENFKLTTPADLRAAQLLLEDH